MEEISQITKEVFIELVGRLRQPGIPRLRLYGHTNPQPTKGWIHEIFVEKNKGLIHTEDESGKKGCIQYRRIIAATTDNPYLTPDYIASLKDLYDEEYYRIFVLGQDGNYMQGLVVKGWAFPNEDKELVYNPELPIYLSCDFNVDPMCWALAQRVNGEFHFFDELYMEDTDTEETMREFITRYGDHKAGIVITGDQTGNNRRSEAIRSVGSSNYKIMLSVLSDNFVRNVALDIPSVNPPIADRVAAFNTAVCTRNGTRKVRVNPDKCPKLMYNINNLRYHPGTSQIMLPTRKQMADSRDAKALGHMYDAASYLVNRYEPIRRAIMPGTMANNQTIRSVHAPPKRRFRWKMYPLTLSGNQPKKTPRNFLTYCYTMGAVLSMTTLI